eukprot:jgi/Pico_ML_1/50835/g1971.t2
MFGGSGGFDAGTQFAGGGFMPTSPGAGALSGASPGKEKKNTQSLVAVTVKQMFNAASATADDSFQIDGVDVHNVSIVGKIVSATEQSTCLIYKIDDGTGKVEVRFWIDSDDSELLNRNKAEWQVGVYVRVTGQLRTFQGQRNVVAFQIRPVSDFNEVTYHFLEVVYAHLHRTNGMKAAGASAAAGIPGSGTPGGIGMGSGMDPCQQMVLSVFNSEYARSRDIGVGFDELCQNLNGQFTPAQIRQAIDFLVNDGHVYSTIDENHFKSTAF